MLSVEQKQIQEAARRFSEKRLAPNAALWDERESMDLGVLRDAAAMGFASINVATDHGGLQLGRLDAALIFEELSAGCVASAAFLSIQNAVTQLVARHGSGEMIDKWLGRLMTLESFGSYCLTEPSAGSDVTALSTRASLDGDHYVLSGVKQFISGAGISDVYLVIARTSAEEISCFLVEKGCPGLTFGRPERKLGWRAQQTAQVILDHCRVPVHHRVGSEGDGVKIVMEALSGARLNIAACSLGPAKAALNAAIRYAQQRRQFNRPLIEMPTIQDLLARMATSVTASRLLVHSAAAALDGGNPDALMLCAMAKWQATETGYAVVDDALQIHGGYGYMRDLPFERWLRDLRAHKIVEGTNEIMRLIVYRELRQLA